MTESKKEWASATLVAATDLSSTSERCVIRALRDAEARSANLHVIHVMTAQVPPGIAGAPAGAVATEIPTGPLSVEEHLSTLDDQVGRLMRAAGVNARVTCHVGVGSPAKRVVELAADLGADLIYTGTRSRTGLSRALLGSVAEKIVRHAPCSVLVVKSDEVRNQASGDDPDVPQIEPPCPKCLAVRWSSKGEELWCDEHQRGMKSRHRYHHVPRNVRANENMPLVFPES